MSKTLKLSGKMVSIAIPKFDAENIPHYVLAAHTEGLAEALRDMLEYGGTVDRENAQARLDHFARVKEEAQ